MKKYFLAITVLFVMTAASYSQNKVIVKDIWIGELPPSSPVAAAYMKIVNPGDADDQLLSVTSPIAGSTMIHTTEVDSKGVATMEMIDALDIPAGKTVELKPGGTHIMLMDLKEPVTGKDAIELDFKFKNSGNMIIMAPVKQIGDMDSHKH